MENQKTQNALGPLADDLKTELFSNALAGEAVETACVECLAVEWVIPLDVPLDLDFLANYLCDECEAIEPSHSLV